MRGSNGQDGRSSLAHLTSEAAGANCSFGGVHISSGLDANRNGLLEGDEVANSKFVCHGVQSVAAPLDLSSYRIENLGAPLAGSDAATKAYVDAAVASAGLPTMLSQESSATGYLAFAAKYCRDLVEGGFSDWRIPTVDEIAIFADPSESPNYIWTKTLTNGGAYIAIFRLNFGQASWSLNTAYARCVR